jgi:chlorophyll/bacteriochlorophyll a synthase
MQDAIQLPRPAAVAELFKPITWFPPMWAFACGAIAAGANLGDDRWRIAIGLFLAGPMVCATSQAVNDWFDREVDAINEPLRPIPSGRIPGRWGLWIAQIWTLVSIVVASFLGPLGLAAAAIGLALAWAYSAPPLRLKQNGWWGNAACGLCYEGVAWVTGAAVVSNVAAISAPSLWLAFLYSLSAHGIMTLNDFKAIQGDRQMGIASLPVQLGPVKAAWVAAAVMLIPQLLVVGLLVWIQMPWHAVSVFALIVGQAMLLRPFLANPISKALFFSGFGVPVLVSGMMISAFAVRFA